MLAFLPLLFVSTLTAPDTPNEFEILQHVKLNVQGELARAANYTCVQTIERTYYQAPRACVANVPHPKPRQYMRDRLRLDVAVSEGNEIFSWHGETKFTSSNIADIIPNGPRSSGQFVGFLRNIFLTSGIQFAFKGAAQWNGKPVYTFDYVVQVLRSTYLLKGRGEATIIPYHGSFSVDADSFELIHLRIIADDIPAYSGICVAETDLDYQIVRISGRESLLPAAFTLKMESDGDIYTLTRNDYTQCREFRGESTLLFTPIDPAAPATTRHIVDEPLPAGLTLKATLLAEITDKNSYVGDAVEGILAEPLTIPGTQRVIPKGAKLHGVISEMEQHTEGLSYWLFGIKLERLESGGDTYVLKAWPLPAYSGNLGTPFSGDRVLSSEAIEAARRGYWFMDGSHFKLPKNFTRFWHTV